MVSSRDRVRRARAPVTPDTRASFRLILTRRRARKNVAHYGRAGRRRRPGRRVVGFVSVTPPGHGRVNPSSPTGRIVERQKLGKWLPRVAVRTRVWVDETYVDYVEGGQSAESVAAGSANVVVCKSMSKAYALSGMRCAYLCGAATV